jgi:hypothetical protein
MRDLNNNLDCVQSIHPAAKTATVNGTGVDLQGYEGCEVEFDVGTITDGTHTPKLQESNDNSAWNDVAAIDLLGTALVALVTNTHQRIGYRGAKRYVRPVVTVAGATTGGVYGAMVVRGHKRHKVSQAV